MRELILLSFFTLVISVQGCALFTYPSPQPVEGNHVVHAYPNQHKEVCLSTVSRLWRSTQDSILFGVEGGVGFCFTSPLADNHACVRGLLGRSHGESSPLIFQVYVGVYAGGEDVVLGVNQAFGTLDTNGRTVTEKAQVQYRPFLDMPQGVNVDGRLRYNVNGAWLSFADAAPYFSRPGYSLIFRFDQECDPGANYQLAITGLTVNGHALLVPRVDFKPYSEWVFTFD